MKKIFISLNTIRRDICLRAILLVPLAFLGLAAGVCYAEKPALSSPEQTGLREEEGTVFRTGITGAGRKWNAAFISYAVSPDGTRILFSAANRNDDGFLLLNLKSGQVSQVPGEKGRRWFMPQWSRDGKQVLAISGSFQDRPHRQYEQRIILLNSADWSYRKLAIPVGRYNAPSFSADGKLVFFIKGTVWQPPESNRIHGLYSLYAYDLASGKERQLINEEAYVMTAGYDDGQELFFSALWTKQPPSLRPNSTKLLGIYALNKESSSLRLLEVDQGEELLDPHLEGLDKSGNIYFTANMKGGNYIRTAYRCNAKGQNCARLTEEVYFFSNVEIAYQTGEVFVDDRLGNEIVFRRLSQSFVKQ